MIINMEAKQSDNQEVDDKRERQEREHWYNRSL